MSSVLSSIIEGVLEDVAERKRAKPSFSQELKSAAPVLDAYSALTRDSISLIAEVKRSSPSKGALAPITNPVALAVDYQNSGASVVSVLTERRRFGGAISDLVEIRRELTIPILRKDFIVTEYQIEETRAIGADLILLIVAGLSQTQLVDFYQMATELGLHVLVEVHDQNEIERGLEISPRIMGVNARNLKTLEINPRAFAELIPLIPSEITRVAESGISDRTQVVEVENLGARAILVGETLVKAKNTREGIERLLGL